MFFLTFGIKTILQNGSLPQNFTQTIIKTNLIITVFILLFGTKFLKQTFNSKFGYNNTTVIFRSFNNTLYLHLSKKQQNNDYSKRIECYIAN